MNDEAYARKRNRRKVFRVAFQSVILALVVALLLYSTILHPRYKAVDMLDRVQEENGFLAISYFGVATEKSKNLISQSQLAKHLSALKKAGFVTITQRDIMNYYYNHEPLPERALFLFFEDGQKQSAVLAQTLLQINNYIASMFTYANNLQVKVRDAPFLSSIELNEMKNTTFWEMGTNGYRLSYINVEDRHGNYLGELTTEGYYRISPYIDQKYDHFLMDYLRDSYGIPMESQEQMRKRIEDEYILMESVYTEELGQLPNAYSLMHANTGKYGTNDQVSVENEMQISMYFNLTFNREMSGKNTLETNVHDLTRMQPQPSWSTNHLLMRINDDMGMDIPYETGDEQLAEQWQLGQGVAEHTRDTLYLTSEPEDIGLIHLREVPLMDNLHFQVRLQGNKLGSQSVDFTLEDGTELSVEIRNNILRIYPKAGLTEQRPILERDLDELDGVVYQTMEENRQEAMDIEISEKRWQSYRAEESRKIAQDLIRDKRMTTSSDNSFYTPAIGVRDPGDRLLEIGVEAGQLTVYIDGKRAAEDVELSGTRVTGLALRCAWGEYGTETRRLSDTVYDGEFHNLYLTTQEAGQEAETVLLDHRSRGEVEFYAEKAKDLWEQGKGVVEEWMGE